MNTSYARLRCAGLIPVVMLLAFMGMNPPADAATIQPPGSRAGDFISHDLNSSAESHSTLVLDQATITPTLSPTATNTPLPSKANTRLLKSTALPNQSVTPSAPAVKGDTHPSPNGEYTALLPFYSGRVVMTSKAGRRAEWAWPKWFGFVGWTPDSRYAIMNYYDQYGNSWAQAFDTTRWKLVPIAPSWRDLHACTPTMEGDCKEGATSITPDGKSVLLYDGSSVNLADLTQ